MSVEPFPPLEPTPTVDPTAPREPMPPLEPPALGGLSERRVLSRDTLAGDRRFSLEGDNLNAWCRLPGSPFSDGLLLLPNRPGLAPPVVRMGPIEGPGLSAITCLFTSPASPEHPNRLALRVAALDSAGRRVAEEGAVLACGERVALTLAVPDDLADELKLEVEVSFEHFAETTDFGSLHLRYLAGYPDNELMRLFNQAGSDKGSEVFWGEGVPHFYALVYEPLLSPLRDQELNLLEIGLDTASQSTGTPTDAPSLRVWREYLRQATLFGYDIHDFGFLEQRDTHVFRGDQGSPADLRRFLDEHGRPRFRVIIDDGSHVPSHQQTSFAALFEQVEPGGVYIIEDLSWQPYPEQPRTADVLRRYLSDGRLESPFIPPEDAQRIEQLIDDVVIAQPNDSKIAIVTRNGLQAA